MITIVIIAFCYFTLKYCTALRMEKKTVYDHMLLEFKKQLTAVGTTDSDGSIFKAFDEKLKTKLENGSRSTISYCISSRQEICLDLYRV